MELDHKCKPRICKFWNQRIEVLPKGGSIEIEVKGLILSSNFLSSLTEKIVGELVLEVSTIEKKLFNKIFDIDILTFDQWNGIGTLPEMLAAFITPNHPELSKIIVSASVILKDGLAILPLMPIKV